MKKLFYVFGVNCLKKTDFAGIKGVFIATSQNRQLRKWSSWLKLYEYLG
jgi:predicted methyltransferase